MLFNSWLFLAFIAGLLPLYYLISGRSRTRALQTLALISASFFFYGFGNPPLVFLLAVSIAGNCLAAAAIVRFGDQESALAAKRKKWALSIAITFNLALLGFFKYALLLVSVFWPAVREVDNARWFADIPLPVGISFYTFQGISMLVDLYRGDQSVRDSLYAGSRERRWYTFVGNVALYISFFPQLVAGPIVKAHDFFYQIGAKKLRSVDWEVVVRNLILGFFLKMVVADNLKEATALMGAPHFRTLPGLDLCLLVYAYSAQIFADFAGYSLIAIGLGRLFGYQLPINFNFPYLAASVTEFWRRWHISLSTWLREYLYIPLGGNRLGGKRTYFNLLVVMVLGGLWHGAQWSYAVWGLGHGILLMIERFLFRRGGRDRDRVPNGAVVLLQRFLVFNLVSWLWLLFVLPDFSDVLAYLGRIGSDLDSFSITPRTAFVVLLFSSPVWLYHVSGWLRERVAERPSQSKVRWSRLEPMAYGLMLFLIFCNSGSPGEFIYFQF